MSEGIPHNRVIYTLLAFVGALVFVIALILTTDSINDGQSLREKRELERELTQLKEQINSDEKVEIPVYIDKKGAWTVAENTSKDNEQKTPLYNLAKDPSNSLRCVDLRSSDDLLGLLDPVDASRNDPVLRQALTKYLPEESLNSFFAVMKTSLVSDVGAPLAMIDKLCKTADSFVVVGYDSEDDDILILTQISQTVSSDISYNASFYTPLKISNPIFAELDGYPIVMEESEGVWRVYAINQDLQAFDLIEACESGAQNTTCSREVLFGMDGGDE